MRHRPLMRVTAVAIAHLVLFQAEAGAQDAADEAAIRAIVQDQYTALLEMDAARYASHLAAEAEWENALGTRYVGRDSIEAFIRRVVGSMEEASYRIEDVSVNFVVPSVAVVDVKATLMEQIVGGRTLAPRDMLNTYVFRKENDTWRIAVTRIRDKYELKYLDE